MYAALRQPLLRLRSAFVLLSGIPYIYCNENERTDFLMPVETQDVNAAIQKANERFELIAKATHDTIWDWDLRTNQIWWNENFQHMFGFSPSEIEPDVSSWTNRIHPDDKDRILKEVHHVIDHGGSNWQGEYRFRKADGTYATVLDRGYTLHDEQGAYRMVGSMLDITERKKAEERLQDSEERLRMAVEATRLGTWDFNPQTGQLRWDKRCKELFGLPPDQEVDYPLFLQALYPDDRERVNRIVQNTFRPESGGFFDTEYRTVGLEDGHLRWVSARGRAFFNQEGKPFRFIGTVIDITGRKMAEEDLKRSDEKLREALLVASTGTWRIDLETGIDTRDASLNKMLGLEAVESRHPIHETFARIHPDDQERMKAALEKAVAEKGTYDEECRIFRPDGHMRWLKDRGQVVLNQAGEALYVIGAATDVTAQKRKEEDLKLSEERFKGLFNNSSVGMALVDLNGCFLDVNPVYEEMFGYTKEEFLKTDVQTVTHPAFIQIGIAEMEQCIMGERSQFTAEKKYIRKNGGEFWGQLSVSLVRDLSDHPKHFIAILTNVHDRKLAEESLKLQARVLESMDEGVSVADENGIILYTNAAEDSMFGYEPGELIGQHVTVQNAYTPEENAKIVASVIEELKLSGYWNGEWHNRRKDGTDFYTYSHITSLDLGERRVLVCVQRDITEEKNYKEALQRSAGELEKRVQERTRELKEANEQLERSNADLEQFAYITSHDLQEPLRKIKTFASRIEDELTGSGQETVLRYLHKVTTSAERMSTLIKDLLNYSRLTTKEDKGVEEVDLNEVVNDVLSDLEVLVTQKKATIKADPLPKIKGIRLQLSQLFFNLIGNSLKFSRPGVPPEILVTVKKLLPSEAFRIGLKPDPFYQLTFRDNGIGFNPAYKEQIFEIFQRLNSRDTYAGTGIGLALSKRVVDNHNGAIIADSAEGKGATFTVYLPAGE